MSYNLKTFEECIAEEGFLQRMRNRKKEREYLKSRADVHRATDNEMVNSLIANARQSKIVNDFYQVLKRVIDSKKYQKIRNALIFYFTNPDPFYKTAYESDLKSESFDIDIYALDIEDMIEDSEGSEADDKELYALCASFVTDTTNESEKYLKKNNLPGSIDLHEGDYRYTLIWRGVPFSLFK